jgi:hypothetical protein
VYAASIACAENEPTMGGMGLQGGSVFFFFFFFHNKLAVRSMWACITETPSNKVVTLYAVLARTLSAVYFSEAHHNSESNRTAARGYLSSRIESRIQGQTPTGDKHLLLLLAEDRVVSFQVKEKLILRLSKSKIVPLFN